MTARRSRTGLLAGWLLALAVLVGPASPAHAQSEPPFSDWNPELAGLPSDAKDWPRANCAGGSDECIVRTIGEMERRFHRMVPTCDHNNVFALTYLRVTENIREGIETGFWADRDRRWINVQDALFARLYFLSYENWQAGRRHLVPESWRLTYDAAARRELEGMGNLLMSMNAHVQRDFPFTIYGSGLVREDAGIWREDGSSRKGIHTAYNERLRAMMEPILEENARRFDARMTDYSVPGITVDDDAFFQLLIDWREQAWRNAVRLAEAADDAERRRIGGEIEDYATAWARLIHAGTLIRPAVEGNEAREARCAEHGGQRTDYPRGADSARPLGRATLRGGRLGVRLRCPRGVGPCVGTLRSFRGSGSGRRATGARRYAIEAGRRGRVRLPLGRSERRRLRDPAVRRVELRARSLLGPGDTIVRRVALRVRRAG